DRGHPRLRRRKPPIRRHDSGGHHRSHQGRARGTPERGVDRLAAADDRDRDHRIPGGIGRSSDGWRTARIRWRQHAVRAARVRWRQHPHRPIKLPFSFGTRLVFRILLPGLVLLIALYPFVRYGHTRWARDVPLNVLLPLVVT